MRKIVEFLDNKKGTMMWLQLIIFILILVGSIIFFQSISAAKRYNDVERTRLEQERTQLMSIRKELLLQRSELMSIAREIDTTAERLRGDLKLIEKNISNIKTVTNETIRYISHYGSPELERYYSNLKWSDTSSR